MSQSLNFVYLNFLILGLPSNGDPFICLGKIIMKNNTKILSILAACSLVLVGCGSDDKPAVTKLKSTGVITGFGSVYVNGTRYITDTSNIIHNATDGAAASSLKVGMKVVVSADQPADGSAPIAAEVKYLADVIGPIQAIDLINSSLTVLGQTYFINSSTKFDSLAFKELTTKMFVEISAYRNGKDQYIASYIEVATDSNAQQLVGKIAELNSKVKTFTIGDLLLDYSRAEVEGTLADGATVEVKTSQPLVTNIFMADEVAVEDRKFTIGEELAISGVIRLIRDDNFILEEQYFTLTPSTLFTQGTKAELVAGSQVSLLASVTENKSLNVNEIRLELATEISIEAVVEAITEISFTLLGQEFYVDQYSQYEDDSELALRNFTFTDIAIGDLLDVDAFDNDGKLVSHSIEREKVAENPEEEEAEVTGKVDNIELPNFSVKGIVIATNQQTEFENAEGQKINQAEFFVLVTLDDVVEAEMNFVDGQWLAKAVELEGVDPGNKKVALLGVIEDFATAALFTVNGVEVITTQATEYYGRKISDLALGYKLEVEGRVNESGQIVAKEIKFISK